MNTWPALPIDPLLPELSASLTQHTRLVLQAPPGAGKTTRVPLALLEQPWLAGRKILLLEPRRLATRGAARRMAESLGEKLGQRVGYRMRGDQQVGPSTRIEVLTEGLLTRYLQRDPALEDVGLVIFDEFHERSLQADLGLALCLDCQQGLREDLRLLVMSATLDGAAVAHLLGDAPILTSPGRAYPVTIRHQAISAAFDQQWPDYCQQVARSIATIYPRHDCSILVFLPGMAEIRRVEEHLQAFLSAEVSSGELFIAPLHGQLDLAAQDRAIQPTAGIQRKIVLATSIAETSLTIEGVDVVIDAGLMRVPQFDPNTGLTRLLTQRVSQAAADQRAGRAGRLRPGHGYRLWSESTRLQAFSAAEMLQADLAPLALELTQWGVTDASQLAWLDPPPTAALAQAWELLSELGAVDPHYRLTAHGAQLARFGTHPRLAHLLLRGHELGLGALACDIAALLEERDPCPGQGSDLEIRLRWLQQNRNGPQQALRQRIRQQARSWHQQLQQLPSTTAPPNKGEIPAQYGAGVLLAYAYPDRIARRRSGQEGQGPRRYLTSQGRGAQIPAGDALAREEFIIAAWLEGGSEARIRLAAAISQEQLERHHGNLIQRQDKLAWDSREQAVQALRQWCLGALVLRQQALTEVSPEQIAQGLLAGIRSVGLNCLPWDDAAIRLRERLNFLHQLEPQHWPNQSDEHLLAQLEDWLAPYLSGMSRLSHLKRLNLHDILRAQLDWPAQQRLEHWAPSHWQVPSGSRIAIDYSQSPPVLAVRLQEVFGLTTTPALADGRVAMVLHLLSPARRPVQITQDLAGFWHGSYQAVKKDLKGRYPKHYWPEDPHQAEPTARAKPRGT